MCPGISFISLFSPNFTVPWVDITFYDQGARLAVEMRLYLYLLFVNQSLNFWLRLFCNLSSALASRALQCSNAAILDETSCHSAQSRLWHFSCFLSRFQFWWWLSPPRPNSLMCLNPQTPFRAMGVAGSPAHQRMPQAGSNPSTVCQWTVAATGTGPWPNTQILILWTNKWSWGRNGQQPQLLLVYDFFITTIKHLQAFRRIAWV